MDYRRVLAGIAATEGRPALHARLQRVAPALARRLHPNDEVRVVRALERVRSGGAATVTQNRWEAAPAGDICYVGLTMDRARLASRLHARAEAMVRSGLLHEVRRLLAHGYGPELSAMQGIGYREFVEVAAGRLRESDALALMQRETVRYARRQWTWFAREPGLAWLDVEAAGSAEGVAAAIERQLRTGGIIE